MAYVYDLDAGHIVMNTATAPSGPRRTACSEMTGRLMGGKITDVPALGSNFTRHRISIATRTVLMRIQHTWLLPIHGRACRKTCNRAQHSIRDELGYPTTLLRSVSSFTRTPKYPWLSNGENFYAFCDEWIVFALLFALLQKFLD